MHAVHATGIVLWPLGGAHATRHPPKWPSSKCAIDAPLTHPRRRTRRYPPHGYIPLPLVVVHVMSRKKNRELSRKIFFPLGTAALSSIRTREKKKFVLKNRSTCFFVFCRPSRSRFSDLHQRLVRLHASNASKEHVRGFAGKRER